MSNEEEEESRSERLRRRRQQSPDRTQEDTTGEIDKMSEPAEPSKPSETSVKEEQVGTYMYLPQSQKKELDRLYNVLKADYEFEFDEAFEKNRHFFPLVVQYGLDSLDKLDAQEIQEKLSRL